MSNTGATLGGAGGSAIGAAFGGPMGAQIGGGIGGALGGLFDKNKAKPSKTTTTYDYLNEDQLQRGYNEADTALDRAQAIGPFMGKTYQELTPEQQRVLSSQTNFAREAQGQSGQVLDASGRLVDAGSNFGLNAQNLYSETLARDPNANRDAAFAYSQGPQTDALVDAASRDITRNLGENTMNSLQGSITSAGGRNSSRAGAAEAIARRGAADQIADTSAAIRQNQYDQEFNRLRTGERDRMSDLTASNDMLSRSFSQGTSGVTSGINQTGSLLGMQSSAADAQQRDQQNMLDDKRSNFDRLRMDDFDVLGRYNAAVGPAVTKTATTIGEAGTPAVSAAQGANTGSQVGFNMGELLGSFMNNRSGGTNLAQSNRVLTEAGPNIIPAGIY